MKKYIIFIAALGLNVLLACNVKEARIEEEAYNPFDTSDQSEIFDSAGDTLYGIDSTALNPGLTEPK